jgi:hypothetical protein
VLNGHNRLQINEIANDSYENVKIACRNDTIRPKSTYRKLEELFLCRFGPTRALLLTMQTQITKIEGSAKVSAVAIARQMNRTQIIAEVRANIARAEYARNLADRAAMLARLAG